MISLDIREKRNIASEKKVRMQEKIHAQDKEKISRKKDPQLHTTDGVQELGPVDFQGHEAEHEGDIMAIAKRDVITVPPTTTIMGAIKTMMNKGFRRIPITDAGTNRLEGIVTSVDIINFMGGGDKNLLVENHYNGNLIAAINAEIREIMENDIVYLHNTDSIDDAIDTMNTKNIGGLPIVDEDNRVHAICTERDFLQFIDGVYTNKSVGEYMNKNVMRVKSNATIEDAAKIMMNEGFRRLPVVKDSILLGIVTATNIMNYLGSGKAFEKLITGNVHEPLNEPISSMITKDVVWTTSDTDLGEAARLMQENNVGSLPIIDNGQFIGIITERDFLKAIVE
ncbi:CBS domain-containing protein [Methanohalobium evestigatum]|uniref:CBS domain-containing protein n=1 Tax=Methanohalobium evestigatum TaxID=2322 RepID=UPI00373AF3AD